MHLHTPARVTQADPLTALVIASAPPEGRTGRRSEAD